MRHHKASRGKPPDRPVAVLTGLREGELLGLAWGDIDWSARQIYVRQQYTAGRFSELKSKASATPTRAC